MNSNSSISRRAVSGAFRTTLRGYQLALSPLLHFLVGPTQGCRFDPSCSEYAIQCFEEHAVGKALLLIQRRLRRCHPWGGAGYDPVPRHSQERSS